MNKNQFPQISRPEYCLIWIASDVERKTQTAEMPTWFWKKFTTIIPNFQDYSQLILKEIK